MSELSPVIRPQRAQTMGNCLIEYLEAECMDVTPAHRNKIRDLITNLIVYLNRRELSPKVLSDYFPYLLKDGGHPNTVKEQAGMIRRFLSWCWKMGYSETRWHEYVPKVRGVPPPDPKIITHEEYLKLRKAAVNQEQEWLIVCGYNTGFRLGDCCMVTWSQVDQEKQVICRTINKTSRSTGARSEIPYASGGDLHLMLVRLKEDETMHDTGRDYVCPILASSYTCCQANESMKMKLLFRRARIFDKSFKHLRSTFESRLANSGMNMALAAKITGRSDLKSILRYVRPDIDAARAGVAKALELHHTNKEFA